MKECAIAPALLQIVPGFRVGIVPVLGTMPSIFGMAAASHILCQLAEQPFNPEPLMDITLPQFETQVSRLLEREETNFGNTNSVAVDYNDVSVFHFHSDVALPCLQASVKKHWNSATQQSIE